ncbi:hypothetical protein QTP70_030041, partial [Hemibagrus guttatus]
EAIGKELSRYGRMVSPIKKIPLGYMKCFKCGKTGHLVLGILTLRGRVTPVYLSNRRRTQPSRLGSFHQKPTGATPAPEEPCSAKPVAEEPCSARPDRVKPCSTQESSVGSGAVLELTAQVEAGTEVQGNHLETPHHTSKGRGKKQAKKETKVEEGELDSDDCISDSVLTFDSQEEQINVVYSAEDIKEFLRNTKWQKNVALEEFFPDHKQFIHDVREHAPSKFFFSLEQKDGQKRFIHSVRTESGDVLCEPTEIHKQTVSFYSKLYSSEWSGAQVVEENFLVDLPRLSEKAARELDMELMLEELHEALQGMENGWASGIDGLPVEFYKGFWAVIGQDVQDALWDSVRRGKLPLICRRAVQET